MQKQRARTEEEKEFRSQKIIESAKKLFSEKGFQGTKIGMITSDAGLSPAAFYLYFKNKFQVYRTISIIGTSILAEMIQSALSIEHDNSFDKIKALAGAYFNFYDQEREYYDIISVLHLGQKEFFKDNDLVPQLENQSLNLLKVLESIIQEGIKRKEFRKVDAWRTAVTLWGMMDGVLIMEIRGTTQYVELNISELISTFMDIVLSALAEC